MKKFFAIIAAALLVVACGTKSIEDQLLGHITKIEKAVKAGKFEQAKAAAIAYYEWMESLNESQEEELAVALIKHDAVIMKALTAWDDMQLEDLGCYEEEEVTMAKSLERVDIVTRIGPTLGLMGTLIPMGPGLAALGSGDVTTLANAIIVAFDTTVVGIGAGAVAYVISKIRRRWYEEYSSNLQLFVNAVLENLNK